MIDPLIILILRIIFSALFLFAALHKLSSGSFRGIVSDYNILPAALIPMIAISIPIIEIIIGFSWALNFLPKLTALITSSVLTTYTAAIGINLLRGRRYIDCGCGFSSTKKPLSSQDSQQLSGGLILRNIILIAFSILVILPSAERLLGVMDYFSAIAASAIITLLFAGYNQLLSNSNHMSLWRQTRSGGSHG